MSNIPQKDWVNQWITRHYSPKTGVSFNTQTNGFFYHTKDQSVQREGRLLAEGERHEC